MPLDKGSAHQTFPPMARFSVIHSGVRWRVRLGSSANREHRVWRAHNVIALPDPMFRNPGPIVSTAAANSVSRSQFHVCERGCERVGTGRCVRLIAHPAPQINCLALREVETLRLNFIRHGTKLLIRVTCSYGGADGADALPRGSR